ncbi:hypothetical protein QTP88_015306 [Uroleucon formosanum]
MILHVKCVKSITSIVNALQTIQPVQQGLIQVARQIFVPNIPAGVSNTSVAPQIFIPDTPTGTSNTWVVDSLSDNICVAVMDEYENRDLQNGITG